VIAFSYPVVPLGKERIRVQLSAAHSTEDIEVAVSAFVDVRRELG
jgi:glycine C-acetyltransferase